MKSIKQSIGTTKELSVAMSPYLYCAYPDQTPLYVLLNNKSSLGRTDNLMDDVDYVGLMSYDYGGTWNSKTEMNAPLYYSNNRNDENPALFNVSGAVDALLTAGVPAIRLNLGLPFYDRFYTMV